MPLPGGPADKFGNRYVLWWTVWQLVRLLCNKHAQVEVAELSLEEVRTVLSADHFSVDLFSPRRLELLRPPQNLSLFLDIGFDPTIAPTFRAAKELFDRYWDAKRRAVTLRAAPLPDQWAEVINLLSDEIARTQQLSVVREKLDRFELFVQQMASEGVLAFEQGRYSFGHESFFDYGGPPRIHRAPWAGRIGGRVSARPGAESRSAGGAGGASSWSRPATR